STAYPAPSSRVERTHHGVSAAHQGCAWEPRGRGGLLRPPAGERPPAGGRLLRREPVAAAGGGAAPVVLDEAVGRSALRAFCPPFTTPTRTAVAALTTVWLRARVPCNVPVAAACAATPLLPPASRVAAMPPARHDPSRRQRPPHALPHQQSCL